MGTYCGGETLSQVLPVIGFTWRSHGSSRSRGQAGSQLGKEPPGASRVKQVRPEARLPAFLQTLSEVLGRRSKM